MDLEVRLQSQITMRVWLRCGFGCMLDIATLNLIVVVLCLTLVYTFAIASVCNRFLRQWSTVTLRASSIEI